MMYTIKKAWENVFFTAQDKDGIEQTVELNFNRTTLDFSIEEAGEMNIRFDKNTLQEAYLKLKAIKVALNYVEEETLKIKEENGGE